MPSKLQNARLEYQPKIPKILESLATASVAPSGNDAVSKEIADIFPRTCHQPYLVIGVGAKRDHHPLRVGVVLSGGQAPGGHNVISGLFDALKTLNPKSTLMGFLGGPSGIVGDKTLEITHKLVDKYRNMGGFDMIGSGRTKIETDEQFSKAEAVMRKHELDGLVVVGGDDSNTNAALLAEYFLSKGCKTCVVGVPKTIDGDLKSDEIECSFGFDTAAKTYAATVGSMMRDALSAKKYYYFIKLMGRSASHLALECALQTHPNITLISEEVAADKKTLAAIVDDICDVVLRRADLGKDYGVIVIPEGLIEFIPEVKILIEELNAILSPSKDHAAAIEKIASRNDKMDYAARLLGEGSRKCFRSLPEDIQGQLLIGRDAHGNVQVSKIETERMLIDMVKSALKQRQELGTYKGKFDTQPHFCGYEGRSCMPSNFDSAYCYALGRVAALLLDAGATGYLCTVSRLVEPAEQWQGGGVPLTSLMNIEKRHGSDKPVIKKALVDLKGGAFGMLKQNRDKWALEDDYVDPGPLQYFGPEAIMDAPTMTLELEQKK